MEISHFELIYKPQSPAGPADTVLQGYFLELTNLEDKALSFRLDLVTSPVTDPDRSLANNTIVFVDRPDGDNSQAFSLLGATDAKRFRLSPLVRVPAHATALVAILPSDPFAMPGAPPSAPNFEARGYVRLTLPAIFRRIGQIFQFRPQSDGPVKVLLTPQNRATYFAAGGAQISAQTQASIPLASGRALNEVEPLPGFSFPTLPERPVFDLERLAEIMDPALIDADVIAGMLSGLTADGVDLGAFNEALRRSGVDLSVARSGAAAEPARVVEPA